jgi:hypothetical protein
MTDKQPEALRLAYVLEQGHDLRDEEEAAAELRRLHQSEREAWRYADELEQERKRLHEVNAELVEALKQIIDLPEDSRIHYKAARRAITKATGEQQ